MNTRLRQAFDEYVQTAMAELASVSATQDSEATLTVVPDSLRLSAAVDRVESSAVFHRLVAEARETLSSDDFHKKGKDDSQWRTAVGHFFRRSHTYNDLFAGIEVSTEDRFQLFCESFTRREDHITFVAPLDGISFPNDTLSFGDFEIRRFKANELNSLLHTDVNEVFYPHSAVDTDGLQNLWFLRVTGQIKAPSLTTIHVDMSAAPSTHLRFTDHPELDLRRQLSAITLFDWKEDHLEDKSAPEYGPMGFEIPFVLEIHDNLIQRPASTPDTSIEMQPVWNSQGNQIMLPYVWLRLNEDQQKQFVSHVASVRKRLTRLKIREYKWDFLPRAIGFYNKAFFSDKIEQLLWYMVCLEALVGTNEPRLQEHIANRISAILGNTKKARSAVHALFLDLYDRRCKLVHGASMDNPTYLSHVMQARSLARRTILWFIKCLDEFQTSFESHADVSAPPKREDILAAIDFFRKNRDRRLKIVELLPEGFPPLETDE